MEDGLLFRFKIPAVDEVVKNGSVLELGMKTFRIPPSDERRELIDPYRSGLLSFELSRLSRLPESMLFRGDLILIILTGLLPIDLGRSGDRDRHMLDRGDLIAFLAVASIFVVIFSPLNILSTFASITTRLVSSSDDSSFDESLDGCGGSTLAMPFSF